MINSATGVKGVSQAWIIGFGRSQAGPDLTTDHTAQTDHPRLQWAQRERERDCRRRRTAQTRKSTTTRPRQSQLETRTDTSVGLYHMYAVTQNIVGDGSVFNINRKSEENRNRAEAGFTSIQNQKVSSVFPFQFPPSEALQNGPTGSVQFPWYFLFEGWRWIRIQSRIGNCITVQVHSKLERLRRSESVRPYRSRNPICLYYYG